MRWQHVLIATLLSFFALTAWARENTGTALPVPNTVSHQLQRLIASPAPSWWDNQPQSTEEWKLMVRERAQAVSVLLPNLHKKMHVSVQKDEMAGIPIYWVTPKTIHPRNRSRILLHFHGGGYVFNPGEAGTLEAIYMAGYGNIKVISVDYRMPPDYPYPAAIDDAVAVYRELLKTYPADKIGVFGLSTGGGITLSLILRAKQEKLPLPAAIAPGTPWTDLTKTGDSYYTNDGIDNFLVSYDGWLQKAALLYANGHNLKDPFLSPIYGNVKGFPPTLLTAGTRDLFLSNTVRMHLKLRKEGVIADLIIFEGLSHAQYCMMEYDAPETVFHFTQLSQFFDQYLEIGP